MADAKVDLKTTFSSTNPAESAMTALTEDRAADYSSAEDSSDDEIKYSFYIQSCKMHDKTKS